MNEMQNQAGRSSAGSMIVSTGSRLSPGPRIAFSVTASCLRGAYRKITWATSRSGVSRLPRRRMALNSIHNASGARRRSA